MSQELTTSLPDAPVATRAGSLCENLVLRALGAMREGRLRLELPDGTVQEFGASGATPRLVAPGVSNTAFIRVRRRAFFTKCVLSGDIGFAESYLDGDWETPDLT